MRQRRPWLKRLSFQLIERQILNRAAAVHFTSQQERQEAAELGMNERGMVLPMGIDLDAFGRLPAPGWLQERAPHLAGRKVVLFLSRLDPKKGLDILLPAFAKVRAQRSDVALIIAGDGEGGFVSGLHAEAVRLGIDADVFWAGFLDGAEKLAAFAAADLFVLPSYSENFGVAAVEAMACGLPVIISNRVGIHGEVAAAGAGLVVPCQMEAVAAAMLLLIADLNIRRNLALSAKRLAWNQFSLQTMTARLVELYTEVLSPANRNVVL
jgi:glycosyltransferase involved in cell wall biosynthesis